MGSIQRLTVDELVEIISSSETLKNIEVFNGGKNRILFTHEVNNDLHSYYGEITDIDNTLAYEIRVLLNSTNKLIIRIQHDNKPVKHLLAKSTLEYIQLIGNTLKEYIGAIVVQVE